MSILSDILYDVAALIAPRRCAVCSNELLRGEHSVCTLCRTTAPLCGFVAEIDNPVARIFWGQVPIVFASSFLFFSQKGGWREAVHNFKYRSQWRVALDLGEWYGRALAESGLYGDVDMVIPLPLHPIKRIRRGYNQSEYLAEGVARQLGVRVDRRSVVRHRNTATQAQKRRSERAQNVESAFSVRNVEALEGRHILLVDDVLTTGSTISSCALEILSAVPTARISVATFAVSRHSVSVKV